VRHPLVAGDDRLALRIDARAFDEAERRFQAAAGDPDPAVRRSARAGLAARKR
jgi:hypothetical protein